MAGSSETAPVLQAKPGMVPEDGPIYQGLATPKKSLADMGLTRVTYVYMEQGIVYTKIALVNISAHEALLNLLEAEEVG